MSSYVVRQEHDHAGDFVGWSVFDSAGARKAGPFPLFAIADEEAYRFSLHDHEPGFRSHPDHHLDL
jgi:hypothetical protein